MFELGKEEPPITGSSHRKLHVSHGGAVGGCLEEVGGGGLRSCGGWCMGFQLRVLAEGWLEEEGVREFRECQLRAEWDCGGASRWALCVDNTV